MGRVLYIQSSPRQDSVSSAVAREFLYAYRDAHPNCEIDTLNLWDTNLPQVDGATIEAKYQTLQGKEHNSEEAAAWNEIVKLIEQFKSADTYVFAVPMWNFGIPYILKHYFDVLVQPGLTFTMAPDIGYRGLVNDRTAVIVYASGGTYESPESQPLDLQRRYLELVLGFIGFQDVRSIVVAPTVGDEESVREVQETAVAKARALAEELT